MDYKEFCLTCLVTLAAINTVLNLRSQRRRCALRSALNVPAGIHTEASCGPLELPKLFPVSPTSSIQSNTSPDGYRNNQKQEEVFHLRSS